MSPSRSPASTASAACWTTASSRWTATRTATWSCCWTDEPDAALFSDDDLTINGGGTLIVTANYNHGIVGKDDLAIDLTPGSGAIIVTAVNDGIKGRDSLLVQGGALTIDAGGDGMQSNNDEDADKGVVTIAGGTIVITAAEDGIQAETRLTVSGGDLTLTTGGGSTFTAADSAKGLKAGVDVTITGGTIVVDAADDAVHANESITISGGVLQLASGDDGVHADATLQIDGGTITVSKSYEGLESAVIVINAGDIQVTASDDGINVAGGADGSAVNGRPGQNQFAASSDYRLTINGGAIVVNALGDGLDANGWIEMTGGVVIVNGPTANNNGALDYDGGFSITGGTLVAAGSAGMAQAPDTTSTQNSLLYTFAATQPAGTMVHIEGAAGNSLVTFTPTHDFQSVVLSSPRWPTVRSTRSTPAAWRTGRQRRSLHWRLHTRHVGRELRRCRRGDPGGRKWAGSADVPPGGGRVVSRRVAHPLAVQGSRR
ncbi:MAG: carbohydrate-binding domain-containing protein [Caldilineaceae bacterium]